MFTSASLWFLGDILAQKLEHREMEKSMFNSILQPINALVRSFALFLFDCFVYDTICCTVIYLFLMGKLVVDGLALLVLFSLVTILMSSCIVHQLQLLLLILPHYCLDYFGQYIDWSIELSSCFFPPKQEWRPRTLFWDLGTTR